MIYMYYYCFRDLCILLLTFLEYLLLLSNSDPNTEVVLYILQAETESCGSCTQAVEMLVIIHVYIWDKNKECNILLSNRQYQYIDFILFFVNKQLIYVPIWKRVGLVESLFDIRDMFNRKFNSFNNPTYKLLSHKSFLCPNLKKALAHYLYTRITLY